MIKEARLVNAINDSKKKNLIKTHINVYNWTLKPKKKEGKERKEKKENPK